VQLVFPHVAAHRLSLGANAQHSRSAIAAALTGSTPVR
jgi:hypothetical protein